MDAGSVKMTDRMILIENALKAAGESSLHDFIAARWKDGNGETWDEIAMQLRTALKDTPYSGTPRETVTKYAVNLGIVKERPKGMARRRRSRTAK